MIQVRKTPIIENESLVPLADTDSVGLGIGRRTLGRRVKNPPDGFPTVLRINGRLYVRRSELEAYKAGAASLTEPIAAPKAA
jgi:hypothetical protein